MRITVLGAGAWGTALGLTLSANEHAVTLWGHRADHLEKIRRTRRNESALPGIDLPEWRCEDKITRALEGAEAVVVAVPSKVFRAVIQQAGDLAVPIISVTKGIELESGLTMSQVLRECAPRASVAALAGPTFAKEVVRG